MSLTWQTALQILAPAAIAYFWGTRTKKFDRFFLQVERSLSEIVSPLFHSISRIYNEADVINREKLVKEFFGQYLSKSTSVYLLGSHEALQKFYDSEKAFRQFQKNRDGSNWDAFWFDFCRLKRLVEIEYWSNLCVYYKEFSWIRSSQTRSWIVRFLTESGLIMYEVAKGLVVLGLILLASLFIIANQHNQPVLEHLIGVSFKDFLMLVLYFDLVMVLIWVMLGTLFNSTFSAHKFRRPKQRKDEFNVLTAKVPNFNLRFDRKMNKVQEAQLKEREIRNRHYQDDFGYTVYRDKDPADN